MCAIFFLLFSIFYYYIFSPSFFHVPLQCEPDILYKHAYTVKINVLNAHQPVSGYFMPEISELCSLYVYITIFME